MKLLALQTLLFSIENTAAAAAVWCRTSLNVSDSCPATSYIRVGFLNACTVKSASRLHDGLVGSPAGFAIFYTHTVRLKLVFLPLLINFISSCRRRRLAAAASASGVSQRLSGCDDLSYCGVYSIYRWWMRWYCSPVRLLSARGIPTRHLMCDSQPVCELRFSWAATLSSHGLMCKYSVWCHP